MTLPIGICAGEPSGDELGAGLIRELRALRPEARFLGIAGPRMRAAGCQGLYPMERLSVVGLVEGAVRLLELLPVRRRLAARLIGERCALFVGIDAPDFNLALEARLHRAGMRTAHYVSPSVWAWRRYRVRSMARSLDRVLTLFPFEEAFYRDHGLAAECVGHPLADAIPERTEPAAARAALGLPVDRPLVALLPGSRSGEVERLAAPMLGAAGWLARRRPRLAFCAAPAAGVAAAVFERRAAALPVPAGLYLRAGQARLAIGAADVVLIASGTATLEAMLVKRPMVITYRTHPLTWAIGRRMLHVEHVGLPNLLAGRRLVPELLQGEATAERLGAAVLAELEQPRRAAELAREFARIHRELRRGADRRAAQAIAGLLEGRR